jgi:hypothetical protein
VQGVSSGVLPEDAGVSRMSMPLITVRWPGPWGGTVAGALHRTGLGGFEGEFDGILFLKDRQGYGK